MQLNITMMKHSHLSNKHKKSSIEFENMLVLVLTSYEWPLPKVKDDDKWKIPSGLFHKYSQLSKLWNGLL